MTFCVLVDQSGALITFNGSRWADSGPADSLGWTSVYCQSATLCFATDRSGRLSIYDGSAWTSPTTVFDHAITAMTCTSATACRAFAYLGNEWAWDGARWTQTGEQLPGIVAIWCATDSSCNALDGYGNGYELANNQWSPSGGIGGQRGIGTVSCAPDQSCVAATMDVSELAYQYTDSWHQLPKPGFAIVALSCVSQTFCLALGENYRAATFDGTIWHPVTVYSGAAQALPPVVSCPTSSWCMAVDHPGRAYEFDGQRTVHTWFPDAFRGTLTNLSCPTKSWCMATDTFGHWLARTSGAWSTAQGRNHQSVSCTSSQACVSVSGSRAYRWDGTSWHRLSSPPSPDYIDSLSCVNAHYCVGVGGSDDAFVLANGRWHAFRNLPAVLDSVSCWSEGNCIAGTDYGYVRMKAGAWQTPHTVRVGTRNYGIYNLSCPGPADCYGASTSAVVHLDHGRVTITRHVVPGSSLALACGGTHSCVDLGMSGSKFRLAYLTGGSWSDVVTAPAPVAAISCPGTHRCIAVGGSTAFTITLP